MRLIKFIKNNLEILAISITYLLSFLYMLPLRDQIYGDDFVYISTVRDFIQTGVLKVSEWSYASMIFQTFWGAAFSEIFGFSLKIMHLSTVVILYPGLIAFYLLLREFSVSKFRSFIFTLFLLFFPHVFFMTYTFLTNIPAMSLAIISVYLYVKGLKRGGWRWFF